MYAKGSSLVGRKTQIIKDFGQARWDGFISKLAAAHPFFAVPVLNSSQVSVEDIIAFNDAMLGEFYNGDATAFHRIGEQSARWAFTEGPLKVFIANKDIKSFVEKSIPSVWSAYYSAGRLEGTYDKHVITLRLIDVPTNHIAFEYVLVGFIREALKLLGLQKVVEKKIYGIKDGKNGIHYEYRY